MLAVDAQQQQQCFPACGKLDMCEASLVPPKHYDLSTVYGCVCA